MTSRDRLPAARAARPAGLQLPLVAGCPGGQELFRAIDPGRFELCGAEPGAAAAGGLGRARCRQRAADPERARDRGGRLERGLDADLARPAAPGPATSERPVALPLRRVRHPRLAADLLRAASARWPATSSRRPPTARPARRRRADVPQGLLPPAPRRRRLAARVLGRHRSRAAARGARHRRGRLAADDHGADLRRRGRDAQIWRVDVGRVPLLPARHRHAAERPGRALDHGAAVRRRPGDPARPVRPARRRRHRARCGRWASSPGSCISTRATRRSPRSSSRAPELRAGAGCDDALEAARDHGPCSPPTPPSPAGNDSYPSRAGRTQALGRLRRRARASRPPRSCASADPDDGRAFGVTQAALRMSRSANGVSRAPRRGRPGDVAGAVARAGALTRSRSAT